MFGERAGIVVILGAALAAAVLVGLALSEPDGAAVPADLPLDGEGPVDSSDSPRLAGRPPPPGLHTVDGPCRLGGVVQRDGRPVLASIEVWRDLEESPRRRRRLQERRAVRAGTIETAADGTFDFGVQEGYYHLVAAAGSQRGVRSIWAGNPSAGRHLRIDLLGGDARLAGRVETPDGRALATTVYLHSVESESELTLAALRRDDSGADGSFVFAGLPAGRFKAGVRLSDGMLVWGPLATLPAAGASYLLVADAGAEHVDVRVVAEATGTPVAGARVRAIAMRSVEHARWTGIDPIGSRSARTATDGRVRIALPEGEFAHVEAWAPGFVVAHTRAALPGGRADLRLVRAGRIRGVVLRSDTQVAAPGLRVDLTSPIPARTTRTDAAGRFGFDGVPPGPVELVTWGDGLVPDVPYGKSLRVRVDLAPAGQRQVELTVTEGFVVVGRVLRPEGEPAAGAEVWIERNQVPPSGPVLRELRGKADADGRFRIVGLPRNEGASWFHVAARLPDTGVGHVGLEDVLVPPRRSARKAGDPVEIVLPRPAFLEVCVVDENGNGIASANAHVRSLNTIRASGTTDEEGRVRIGPLAPGAHSVFAGAVGYCSRVGHEGAAANVPEGGVGTVTVSLRRSCKIGGRLVYADGSPADDRRFGITVRGPRHSMGTDLHGRFHFDDLPWDSYEVLIVDGDMHAAMGIPDDDERVLAHVTLSPGTTDAEVVLRMRRVVPFEVLVRDGRGQPLSGGRVRLLTAKVADEYGSGVWLAEPLALSGGRLEVRGLDKTVWLQVDPLPEPGAMWAKQRLGPFVPGTARVEVDLVPGFVVGGRVEAGDGKPLAGIGVSLWPDDTPQVFVDRHEELARTKTDDQGAFCFDRIPAGEHWLALDEPDGCGQFEPIAVAAGSEDTVLRLHRRVEKVVRVLGADGRPHAQARVQCYEPPWHSPSGPFGLTDREGGARIKGLDPRKRYAVIVTPSSLTMGNRALHVEDWLPAEATFRLPAAGVIRGRVTDEEGKPVPFAYVEVIYADPPALASAQADGQGAFRSQLARDVSVRVVASDGTRSSDAVTARPGEEELVLVVRPRSGKLRLQVQGWPLTQNQFLPYQRIRSAFAYWPVDEPGQVRRGHPTANGLVEVKHLEPGRRYACLIRNLAHPEVVAFVPSVPADGVLRSVSREKAVTLRGRVVLPEGTWLKSLTLVEADITITKLDEQGRYEFKGMPAGRWRIRAHAGRRAGTLSAAVQTNGDRVPDLVFPSD